MRSRPFRIWQLVLVTIALLGVVAIIAPHQLGVAVWKGALVTLAGCLGYWLDRLLYPYARPHLLMPYQDELPQDKERRARFAAMAMIRRAIIVAAAMLAVAIGL
jgi:hypothetical protein